MLHAAEDLIELPQLAGRFARQPDEAVQFIHRAIGLNAEIVLRQTLPARQAGLPRIAAPRVNAVDSQSGLFKSHAHIISPAPDSTSRPPPHSAAATESRKSLRNAGRARSAGSHTASDSHAPGSSHSTRRSRIP